MARTVHTETAIAVTPTQLARAMFLNYQSRECGNDLDASKALWTANPSVRRAWLANARRLLDLVTATD